jgi:hypothetical protein
MVTIADPNFLLGSTIAGAVPLAKSFEQDCCIPCQSGVGKVANAAVKRGGEVGAVVDAGVQFKLELEWMMGVELLLFLVGHEVTEGVKANSG